MGGGDMITIFDLPEHPELYCEDNKVTDKTAGNSSFDYEL
jgi:hypothetical protein